MERWKEKERDRAERSKLKIFQNPDCYFGCEVAERLNKFTPSQKTIAKVIKDLLLIWHPNERKRYENIL